MWLIGIISNHIDGEVHYFLHSDVSLLSWIPSCHPATIIQSAILVFSFMVWTVTEAPPFFGATAFPHRVFQPLRLTERRCNTPWGFLFCTNFTLYVKNVARSWQQKKSKAWVTVFAHLEMSPLRWELVTQVCAAQSGEGGDSFQVHASRQQLGTVLFIHCQAYHTLEVRSWEWVGLFHCSLCVRVIQKSCLLFPYVNCA